GLEQRGGSCRARRRGAGGDGAILKRTDQSARMLAQLDATQLDDRPRLSGAERLCLATRTVRPVEHMIPFVIAPNGEAIADLKHTLPGRGVWVTATRNALDRAVKANAFARGFRRDVRVTGDLVADTERLLENAAVDALAGCRHTGLIDLGLDLVATAPKRQTVTSLPQ